MSKFTPGGWHRGIGNGEGFIFPNEGRMRLEEKGTTLYPICKMTKGWNPEEDEANEIAVAMLPDLISVLEDTLEQLEDITSEQFINGADKVIRDNIRAVLAKLI